MYWSESLSSGKPQEFQGNEIILSSGAIHSPAHLMRSGIGPEGHLRELGIPIRRALPGVGQRLWITLYCARLVFKTLSPCPK